MKLPFATVLGTALITSGTAYAAPSKYVNIQPIQVCDDMGGNCAPINLFGAETKKIWQQADIDVNFLPTSQISNSSFLTIDNNDELNSLVTGAGNGQSPVDTVLNFWFINTIAAPSGSIIFGQVNAIDGNGTVISNAIFDPSTSVGRLDTVAHELGHNLGLGHNTFGAGNGNNLMTAGAARNIPTSINDITPDGLGLDVLTDEQTTEATDSRFVNDTPKITVDTIGSTPFDTNDFFHVIFEDGSSDISLKSLTVDLSPVNAFFDPTDSPPGEGGSPFRTSSLDGISGSIFASGAFDGSQKLTLTFGSDDFEPGDSFNFGIDVDLFSQIDFFGATPSELIGSIFTFEFSDGYTLSSALDQGFVASSLNPIDLSQGFVPSDPVINVDPSIVFDPDPEPISVPEPSSATGLALGSTVLLLSKLRRKSAILVKRV